MTERMTPAQYRRETGQPPKPGDELQQAVGFLLRPRAPRQHPEDDLQAAIVQYLGYSLRPGVLVHHSPNGGRRNVDEAKRFKAAGVMPGWPDLTFVWAQEVYTPALRRSVGLVAFIEVKSPVGRLSPAQVEFQAWCREGGVPHAVVRSLAEAIAAVEGFGLTKEGR